MAAVAFTETFIFQGQNGRVIHVRATCTDVAAAYAAFPDGNTFLQLPSDTNYALRDVITVVGGTDTTNQEVYANGMSTGLIVDNKSNLNTAVSRQFQQAPVMFKAGTLLRFKQLA